MSLKFKYRGKCQSSRIATIFIRFRVYRRKPTELLYNYRNPVDRAQILIISTQKNNGVKSDGGQPHACSHYFTMKLNKLMRFGNRDIHDNNVIR